MLKCVLDYFISYIVYMKFSVVSDKYALYSNYARKSIVPLAHSCFFLEKSILLQLAGYLLLLHSDNSLCHSKLSVRFL